jgi:hypothetical protein
MTAGRDQRAVISMAIHERNERPIFVYRSRPERPDDSGWTLTAGETQGFGRDQLGAAHLSHLADHWPELASVFADARAESAWEWDPDTSSYREVQMPPSFWEST